MSLIPGTRLGPYTVSGLLGSGGMAEVYAARDTRLGRDVAIKILPDALAGDAESLARFEREARTASSLNHPNLVTIHDIGDETIGGRTLHFIAMELIRGESLRAVFDRGDVDAALRHLTGVADGLSKAHAAGVIHRDLKPENVMISEDGYAKVVDFGLAKRMPRAFSDADPTARLTEQGMVVGTIAYMAPEQLSGRRDLDHRVDVFAFGCMLYEALSGRNPFEAATAVERMYAILHHDPERLPSAALDRVARRCLAKDPRDRYESMRDVRQELIEAIRTPAKPRRRAAPFAIAAAAALVAIVGGAFFVARRERPAAIRSVAVLPFQHAAAGGDIDFLTDGIAEDVRHDLSRIPALRVIASSSVERYRHAADAQRAARDLNVDAVLVGNLRSSGGTLLLDTTLVNAVDGSEMWGKQYRRTWADVPKLEQEIARDLCAEVRVKLAPERAAARNPEAYAAYLRGKQQFRQQTAQSLKNAIEEFGRAIAIEPDFAEAWSALAQAHGRQTVLGLVPTPEGDRQEEAEAKKALAIDDSVAEAHWTLSILADLRGDTRERDRQEARVLEIDPNFAPAFTSRASRLLFDGKVDAATAAYERARSLDPLSPAPMTTFAVHLLLTRHYDRALAILLDVTEQFPAYQHGYAFLALTYSQLGRHAEALATFDHVDLRQDPEMVLWKGTILARAGRLAEARALADETDRLASVRHLPLYVRAELRADLGDRDAAFALLSQAKREGEWQLRWLPYDPGFDSLRRDPRFAPIAVPPTPAPILRIPVKRAPSPSAASPSSSSSMP